MQILKYIFLAIFLFISAISYSQDEKELAKKIFEKAAGRVKSIECLAETTTYHYEKNIGAKEIKIYGKQPDKLRIEFLAPKSMEGGFVIFDGQTIYQYIPKLKKALKINLTRVKSEEKKEDVTSNKSLDMQLSSITNLVAKDLKKFWEKNEFGYLGKEKLGDKDVYKIQIIPKVKSRIKVEQIIWIDTKTGLTWKVDFKIDIFERQEIIEMKEIKINIDIPDDLFKYSGDIL